MSGLIAIIVFCVFHKWFKSLYGKVCIFCISFWLSVVGISIDWCITNIYFDYYELLKQSFETCCYANIFYFFLKTLHT